MCVSGGWGGGEERGEERSGIDEEVQRQRKIAWGWGGGGEGSERGSSVFSAPRS